MRLAPHLALAGSLLLTMQTALSLSPAPLPPYVVINEVLVDPSSGPEGDSNGDGVRDTYEDEFIELVNRGHDPVDLSGWRLGPHGGEAFTFPQGTVLAPGEYLAVFGGGEPTGLPGEALTADGRLGSGLSNSAGRLLLIDPAGPDTLQDLSYQDWDTDASFVKEPEGSGSFVDHAVRYGARFSPTSPSVDGGSPFLDRPAIYRVRVVNHTSAGFQVAWRTGSPADGRLELSIGGVFRHHFDPAPAGRLHLSGRYGLAPGESTAWRVASAGSMVPVDSTFFTATGPVVTSVPYAVFGQLTTSSGSIARVHVFLRAVRDEGPTGWLLAEADSSGSWTLNLGNLRSPEGGSFAWSTGDTLLVEADGGPAGVASGSVILSGASPQKIDLPALQPDPPPMFQWTSDPSIASADTIVELTYALSDPGEAWARPYLRREGEADLHFPRSEPPVLTAGTDARVAVMVDGLAEGSRWWVGAVVEDGLNAPRQVEAAGPITIAHTVSQSRTVVAGVTLFSPTLADSTLVSASEWLGRLQGEGELARWDAGTGAWASVGRLATGELVGTDFDLNVGKGYALVSATAGTVAVSGPRRYGPGSFEMVPGLSLVGIADSSSVRPASVILADPHVRSVSRWDGYRQAWLGRFRISDGSQLGDDFLVGWGEAVAVEADSASLWQPSPAWDRTDLSPDNTNEVEVVGGHEIGATVLFSCGRSSGSVTLIWRTSAVAELRLERGKDATVWRAGPQQTGIWHRQEVTGLAPGYYRTVLEMVGEERPGRHVQEVEVTQAGPPPWPDWVWGTVPGSANPLLLRADTATRPVTGRSGERWYADLSAFRQSEIQQLELIELLPDGGWTRWKLDRAAEDRDRLYQVGSDVTLSGLREARPGPLALLLSWSVVSADSPLRFRPWLGFEGPRSGGPEGDSRRWLPAGEEEWWEPGKAADLQQVVPLDLQASGTSAPEAVSVEVRFADGRTAWLGPLALEGQESVTRLVLHPAAPNPFNANTVLRFTLPAGDPRPVRLEIRDMRGRRVRSLVDGQLASGVHVLRWNGRDDGGRQVASGVYLVVLDVERERLTRKILLLR
jgi:hypothetical protein